MLVQIEEEKCAIRKVWFVTVLASVRPPYVQSMTRVKGMGFSVSLSCFRCREHDRCGKNEDPPVHLSSEHPTELACLQERLHDPSRHGKYAESVTKKAAACC